VKEVKMTQSRQTQSTRQETDYHHQIAVAAPATSEAPATTTTQQGGSYVNSLLNQSANAMAEAGKSQEQKDAEAGGKNSSGSCGNWLVELAGAMAKIQEKFLSAAMANKDTMIANSDGMTQQAEPAANGGATVGPNGTTQTKKAADTNTQTDTANSKTQEEQKKEREDFIDAQAKFQANMQMFNNIATMTSTTIKTLGEALTGLSRKQ
jgi:hypothetical protein